MPAIFLRATRPAAATPNRIIIGGAGTGSGLPLEPLVLVDDDVEVELLVLEDVLDDVLDEDETLPLEEVLEDDDTFPLDEDVLDTLPDEEVLLTPPVEVEEDEPPDEVEVDDPPVEVEEPPLDVELEPPLLLEVEDTTMPLEPLAPPPKKPPPKNPPPPPKKPPPPPIIAGASPPAVTSGAGNGIGAGWLATVTTAGGQTIDALLTVRRTGVARAMLRRTTGRCFTILV